MVRAVAGSTRSETSSVAISRQKRSALEMPQANDCVGKKILYHTASAIWERDKGCWSVELETLKKDCDDCRGDKEELDFEDLDGNTALSWAAELGSVEAIRVLLDAGASVNHQNETGQPPLMRSVLAGHEAAVAELARKSFLNLKDRDGQTALSYASMLGRPSMCRMFLKGGASVDLADKRGWSPAVWAAKKGHKEVTQLLLDNGALSPRSAKASGRIMHGGGGSSLDVWNQH